MLKSLLSTLGILTLSVLLVQKGVPDLMQSVNAAEPQGIQGTVLCWKGDQMPGVGDRAAAQPVQTTVWIFTGRIPSTGSPRWAIGDAERQLRLVEKVESNTAGEFSVVLPPGEYTLLAQYGSDLYLNSFLGDGSFATVVVEPGQWTPVRLENTEAAFF